MKIETIRKRIDARLTFQYKNNTDWEEHISTLVIFFKTFNENSSKRFVIPKVVCMDRIYKGGLYRQGNKNYMKEIYSFSTGIIANNKEIDDLLSQLKNKRKYNPVFKEKCLSVFESTLKKMQKENRQVLLSKYLHFHAPEFFPILDQFAEKKLVALNKSLNLIPDPAILRGRSRYAKFYYLIEELYLRLDKNYRFIDLDKYLYGKR